MVEANLQSLWRGIVRRLVLQIRVNAHLSVDFTILLILEKFKDFRIRDRKMNVIRLSIQHLHMRCTEILSDKLMLDYSHYQD